MRWAVFGHSGLLGEEVTRQLIQAGEDVFGFDRNNFSIDDSPQNLAAKAGNFDIWVNCIAYTAVDRAESEIEEANRVNAYFAGALANAALISGKRLIHISTDYVFGGDTDRPWKTSDVKTPQNAYGKSKSMGEDLVLQSGADCCVIRTAWLYGEFGNCFPKTIAKKLAADGSARVISDQFGQPTWTRDLAIRIIKVAYEKVIPQIMHIASSGVASWADFAKEVAKSSGYKESSITEISSRELSAAAHRPSKSMLENSTTPVDPIGNWRERWTIAAPSVVGELFL